MTKKLTASALLAAAALLGPGAAMASAHGGGHGSGGHGGGHGGGTTTRQTYVCDVAAPCTAGVAGTVTLSTAGGTLSLTSVQPATGFTYSADDESDDEEEIEVEFRSTTAQVEFKAELSSTGQVVVNLKTKTR